MPHTKVSIFAALFSALIAPLASARAEGSAWQIIKVANRDYLTLDNIAQFYRLRGDTQSLDHRIHLTDGRTQLETTGDGREIVINGVKQWLSFPLLYQNGQILVSRFDLAKTIEPSLRPIMIDNLHPFSTVVIDAGHGGADRGANSTTGFEKDYTLDVVMDLKKALEAKGLRVLMTRDSDTFVTLDGRAQYTNNVPDAIFVSVHFNSSNDGGIANGFEVFAMTPRGANSTGDSYASLAQFNNQPGNEYDNASLALANCVHYSLLGHIPQQDRGVKRARFAVLRLTHAPAVLIEGGFLTNPTESQRINDAIWRRKLAESIAQGVQSYQELANRKMPPKLLVDYRNEQLPLNGVMVDPALMATRAPAAPTDVVPVSNSILAASPPAPPAPAALVPAPPQNPAPAPSAAPSAAPTATPEP